MRICWEYSSLYSLSSALFYFCSVIFCDVILCVFIFFLSLSHSFSCAFLPIVHRQWWEWSIFSHKHSLSVVCSTISLALSLYVCAYILLYVYIYIYIFAYLLYTYMFLYIYICVSLIDMCKVWMDCSLCYSAAVWVLIK